METIVQIILVTQETVTGMLHLQQLSGSVVLLKQQHTEWLWLELLLCKLRFGSLDTQSQHQLLMVAEANSLKLVPTSLILMVKQTFGLSQVTLTETPIQTTTFVLSDLPVRMKQ